MDNKDILEQARKNDPDNYWGGFYLQIAEEYNKHIKDHIPSVLKRSLKLFYDAEQKRKDMPYHFVIPLSFLKNCIFYYEMHLFARTEEEKQHPKYSLIAYYPMPSEFFYVFMLNCDETGEMCMDIFPPHLFPFLYF